MTRYSITAPDMKTAARIALFGKFTNGRGVAAPGSANEVDIDNDVTGPRYAGPESIGRGVVRDCAHDLKNRHEDGSNAGPVVTKTRRRNDS
jgi:hypothetical protein